MPYTNFSLQHPRFTVNSLLRGIHYLLGNISFPTSVPSLMRPLIPALLFCAATLASSAQTTDAPDISAFLSAYARGDAATVLPQLSPDITIYGSDAAEIFHGRDEARRMLEADQQLWQHAAHIGAPEHLTTLRSGDLFTAFFDAPFSVGDSPALTVRFAMVWQKSGDRWLLIRSSNTVPTHGQSAAELLHAH